MTHDRNFTRLSTRLSRAIADGKITLRERSVVLSVAKRPVLQSLATSVLDAPNVRTAYRQQILGRQLPSGFNGELVPTSATVLGGNQGGYATCVLVAAAAGNLNYRLNPNQTISFRFFRRIDGRPQWITVSNQRDSTGSDELLGAAEIAYGVWADRDRLTAPGQAWQDITDGNNAGEVLYAFTGRFSTYAAAPTFDTVSQLASQGKTILLSTDVAGEYIVDDHAYRVVGVSGNSVTVRNPWGRDGLRASGDPNDGYITLDRQQFVAEFGQGHLTAA